MVQDHGHGILPTTSSSRFVMGSALQGISEQKYQYFLKAFENILQYFFPVKPPVIRN